MVLLSKFAASKPSSSLWQFPVDTTAVVTGGTKGIGKAVVEELAGFENVRVFTCARSSFDLEACIKDWQSRGFLCHGCVADVSTPEGRATLVDAIQTWLGPNKKLDILVNNVGTNIRKPSIEYTSEEYDFVWKTNLESMFALTCSCHHLLRRDDEETSRTSSIVNIGSVAGVTCKFISCVCRGLLILFFKIRALPNPLLRCQIGNNLRKYQSCHEPTHWELGL
jgi:Tropinone reductase 1